MEKDNTIINTWTSPTQKVNLADLVQGLLQTASSWESESVRIAQDITIELEQISRDYSKAETDVKKVGSEIKSIENELDILYGLVSYSCEVFGYYKDSIDALKVLPDDYKKYDIKIKQSDGKSISDLVKHHIGRAKSSIADLHSIVDELKKTGKIGELKQRPDHFDFKWDLGILLFKIFLFFVIVDAMSLSPTAVFLFSIILTIILTLILFFLINYLMEKILKSDLDGLGCIGGLLYIGGAVYMGAFFYGIGTQHPDFPPILTFIFFKIVPIVFLTVWFYLEVAYFKEQKSIKNDLITPPPNIDKAACYPELLHKTREIVSSLDAAEQARNNYLRLASTTHSQKESQTIQKGIQRLSSANEVLIRNYTAIYTNKLQSTFYYSEFWGTMEPVGENSIKIGQIDISLAHCAFSNQFQAPKEYVQFYQKSRAKLHSKHSNKYVTVPLPLDSGWNLIFHDQSEQVLQAIQTIVFRIMKYHEPANARFSFIDTLALGKWAVPFLGLSENHPIIVGRKAWTTPRDIANVIAMTREEIETFIQKRLGTVYADIAEHNSVAKKTGSGFAEPYRTIVFFGLPKDLPKETVDQLLELMRSGPKCGVRVILAFDPNSKPRDFPVQELFSLGTNIMKNDWAYYIADQTLGRFPLTFSPPVPEESAKEIINAIAAGIANNKEAKVSARVWLTRENFQTGSALDSVRIFLGQRSDGRNQFIEFGRNGSFNHHALIVGTTGSGKSGLLRTLVMSGAWQFPPEELQYYLVDLKDGVEFKSFADTNLPHFPLVALKGEPEMCLSILKSLEQERTRRSELFKRAGSFPDYTTYRKATGHKLPRLVIVIDEFQMMFQDEKGEEVSRLLERVAKQGRSYGIHLILCSQDISQLGSRITQVQKQSGIRIALRCNEETAGFVLNNKNTLAVRNLTQSGEAIYNNGHGEEANNSRFQVAFLSSGKNGEVQQFAEEIKKVYPYSPTTKVFDRYKDNRIQDDETIQKLIVKGFITRRPAGRSGIQLHIGDSVDMQPSIAFNAVRSDGNNLLMCGAGEWKAISIMTSILSGLLCQHQPQDIEHDNVYLSAKYHVVDFMGDASDHPGWLAGLTNAFPQVEVAKPKDLKSVLTAVIQGAEPEVKGNTYLILHGLHKYRELVHGGNEVRDIKSLLDDIIRQGCADGVHVIIWTEKVDSFISVFGKDLLKYIDFRVAFNGNVSGIEHFIPRLSGRYVADDLVFTFNTEEGQIMKARPLEVISNNPDITDDNWWKELHDRIKAGNKQ